MVNWLIKINDKQIGFIKSNLIKKKRKKLNSK